MARDAKYIRKRKRNYGYSFLIDIPYENESGKHLHFTKTIRVIDYPSEPLAFLAAKKIRNDALHEIQSGKMKRSIPTLKNLYSQKWILLPLSVNTKEKQDAIFKTALASLEDTRLNDITIADIQGTLNNYAESHSTDAVKRLLTVWRQIYRCAMMLGYEVVDKTDAVVLPKSKVVSKRRDVRMNLDDFEIVLEGLLNYGGKLSYDNQGIWYMLQIMYYTGCRPAEALALTADDIHEDFIRINKSVGSTSKEKQQIVPPKTESSERMIPVVNELRPILTELKQWSRHKYLLADKNGNLRNIDEVSGVIHRVAKKYDVKFNAYMLRHLMSTELLHRGDSVVARDLLGHTSFSMTLDYARSTDQQLLKAMSSLRAENQPKNKSLRQPPEANLKMYWIFRITADMRYIAYIRHFADKR